MQLVSKKAEIIQNLSALLCQLKISDQIKILSKLIRSKLHGLMKKNNSTIVLGIGNDILMDDGIGPRLVERLKAMNSNNDVDYRSAFLGGLDLLDIIMDYKMVILIDAIKTPNGIPGAVYSYTPDDFKETLHLSNIHDTSFLTALSLGQSMGIHLSVDIHIIAIEIVEDRVFGDTYSSEIANQIEEIYQAVCQRVNSLLAGGGDTNHV